MSVSGKIHNICDEREIKIKIMKNFSKKTQILWWMTMGTLVILFHALFQERGIYQQWIAPALFCTASILTLVVTITEQFTNRFQKSLRSF
jgi:hypothetical protein